MGSIPFQAWIFQAFFRYSSSSVNNCDELLNHNMFLSPVQICVFHTFSTILDVLHTAINSGRWLDDILKIKYTIILILKRIKRYYRAQRQQKKTVKSPTWWQRRWIQNRKSRLSMARRFKFDGIFLSFNWSNEWFVRLWNSNKARNFYRRLETVFCDIWHVSLCKSKVGGREEVEDQGQMFY